MRRLACLLLTASLAFVSGSFALAAEPVDNCTTVLGSIGVELRIARNLPPGRKSTYYCAKAFGSYRALIGASRERIQRSLGTPDRHAEDGGWSYFFASRYAEVPGGTPELVFHFGGNDAVESVDCRRASA